jgi:hypothetical protein
MRVDDVDHARSSVASHARALLRVRHGARKRRQHVTAEPPLELPRELGREARNAGDRLEPDSWVGIRDAAEQRHGGGLQVRVQSLGAPVSSARQERVNAPSSLPGCVATVLRDEIERARQKRTTQRLKETLRHFVRDRKALVFVHIVVVDAQHPLRCDT